MDDLISRREAIDRINKQREHLQPDIYPQDKIGDAAYRICAEFIERLPSAQPKIEERKEESAQNVPIEDLISRKAAIDILNQYALSLNPDKDSKELWKVKSIKSFIEQLPSAQPERKKGMWIDAVLQNDNGGLPVQVCDQCNTFFPLAYTGGGHRFCPNCGADMRGDDHDL